MFNDILTVMWKERKGLFRFRGSRIRFLMTMLTPILFAFVFPLQAGPDWVEEFPPVVLSAVIPIILVGITVPESFAGERERHTLETLLASRLPDRAILWGKVLLAVAYGWGMTIVMLLVALILVNLLHGSGRIMLYRSEIAVANVLVSLLMSALIANLGVLVSLRSTTAQGAQQVLISLLLVPLMILQLIPMALFSVVPNGRELLTQWLSVDLASVILVVVAVLVAANAGLLLATMAHFQRARLTLD